MYIQARLRDGGMMYGDGGLMYRDGAIMYGEGAIIVWRWSYNVCIM